MSYPFSNYPARDTHDLWVDSPSHLHTMLSKYHTHCGMGIAYDTKGRWWATQLFAYNLRVGNEYLLVRPL